MVGAAALAWFYRIKLASAFIKSLFARQHLLLIRFCSCPPGVSSAIRLLICVSGEGEGGKLGEKESMEYGRGHFMKSGHMTGHLVIKTSLSITCPTDRNACPGSKRRPGEFARINDK